MTDSAGYQFAVEIHPADWRFPAGNTWIAGWIRPKAGQLITDIRARIHHRVILGLFGLPHPAFTEKSPGHPGSSGPGFSFLLRPQTGATLLRLEARDLSGRWTEFFRTGISAAPDPTAVPAAPCLSQSLSRLATVLLKLRIRNPRRPWIELADELIAAFVAEPLNAHPNPPFVGALEEPHEFGRQRYGLVPVTGWLTHPKAAIVRLSVVIDPLPVTPLPHGLARLDCTELFLAHGGHASSAFVGEIAIPSDLAAPVLLKIFAELDNGGKHLVFARRFTPLIHGATGKMPLQISGFSYLCAIWALFRSARRHALPRHGLIRAARKAWASYQALPAYRPKKPRFPFLDKIMFRAKAGSFHRNFAGGYPAVADKVPVNGLGGPPASTIIAADDDMCGPDASLYFQLGREALTLVQAAVAKSGSTRINAILDLPCGYGRVARWLRTAYPEARLTVSDTQGPGVDFCVAHLGATGVPAAVDGRHWDSLPGPYDIIWCGSLLTHFDRDEWVNHLRRFAERLSPHGVLVFTTHGLLALDKLQSGENDYGLPQAEITRLCAAAEAEGFGYVAYPDTPEYGISVAQPLWIFELITQETELLLLDFRAAAWDQHQDVIVCTRCLPKGKN